MQENIAINPGDVIKADHYGYATVVEVEKFRLKAKLDKPVTMKQINCLWFYPGEFSVVAKG